jgi:methyl-accepting chemotaxis protein
VTQAEIICAVDAVHKVDGALANISGDVDAVHLLLGSMARDNAAQSQAVTEITAAIGSMDKATQQNAAMVEETSAAARSLTVEVSALAEQAAGFKFERRVVNIPVPVDHRHAPKLGAERPALKANYAEIRAPASAMPAPHIGATAATVGGQADWADF